MLTRVAKLEMRVTAEKSARSAISRVLNNDCNRSAQNLERHGGTGKKYEDKGGPGETIEKLLIHHGNKNMSWQESEQLSITKVSETYEKDINKYVTE